MAQESKPTSTAPVQPAQSAPQSSAPPSTGNLIMDAITDDGIDSTPLSTTTRENAKAWESTVDSDDTTEAELFGTASNDTPGDTSSKQTDQSADPGKSAKKLSDKEIITITDENGKRKVEVDYTDRAAIKKAFELMHGSRKWQAERDRAVTSEKKLQETAQRDRQMVAALEQAYQEGGEAGVIDLIAGRSGASEEWYDRKRKREEFLSTAKPHEIEALHQRERLEKLERDAARRESEAAEKQKQYEEMQRQSMIMALEGTVHPIFEKYRFDGKLGDAGDEEFFDDMLWTSAVKRLKPYEDQGTELTRELVDREFRAVAQQIRKRVVTQANRTAAKVVEQRKTEATEDAQAAVVNGNKNSSLTREASELISKGDIKSLFQNWGKYGSAFRKK